LTIWQGEETDKDHFRLRKVKVLSQSEFAESISNESSALVFVHGYNTPFEDALFRLAQIVWDTQYKGVPIAFSWPSKGNLVDYDYDHDSALSSREAFLQVLNLLHANTQIAKVYVVAHSMGNQIVVDALAEANHLDIPLSLTEVVLAAPDVSVDVFKSVASRLRVIAKGITVYASSADKALLASEAKAGGPRAGSISKPGSPLLLPGIETIDVTAVGDDMFDLNHGVYASKRSVIDDIGHLLIDGKHPPNVRTPEIRGIPEGSAQPLYWSYPP
jgi:esterase/lipase superfamily enzyme